MTVKLMIKRDRIPDRKGSWGPSDNVTARERWTLGESVSEHPRKDDLSCNPKSCNQSPSWLKDDLSCNPKSYNQRPPWLILAFFWTPAGHVVCLLAFGFYC